MTVLDAFREGLRRVGRAPALLAGLWLSSFLLALPFALLLRAAMLEHLGASLAADAAADGVNFDWWNEFLAQSGGLGQTFVPAVLGFAAVLKNLSALADRVTIATPIAFVLAANLLLATFLMGGVLDRLARDRRIGSSAFFAACGRFFFRFLRLEAIAAAVYALLFTSIHEWLFGTLFGQLTRDLTVERTAILYRALLYLVFGFLLAIVNVHFDYAKIRMVVEDRRSAIGAIVSGARFIRRNKRGVAGLYVVDTLTFAVVVAIYALVVPGASGGLVMWIGFAVGQLYVVLRIAVRLLFAASQTALFQSRLAHAGYTAAPVAVWPDSAAAEAISPP
jgi:hypothetical protein